VKDGLIVDDEFQNIESSAFERIWLDIAENESIDHSLTGFILANCGKTGTTPWLSAVRW
jgi:hypothetical protein